MTAKNFLIREKGMKRKIFICLIFMAILNTALIFTAHASENKHYVIGVEDLQYYPLWYYDKVQNEYTGLARKMLEEFARSAGYTLEYKPYPIKRLHRVLVAGEVDFKFPDNPQWAQDLKGDTKITYSDPAIDYIDGVFVKPGNVGKGNSSINTLGSVLGFTPWDWLEKIESGEVVLREAPDFNGLINQAIAGRIDGAYVNAAIVRYNLKTSGRQDAIIFDGSLSHTKGHYLLSTTKHPNIINEFNTWMAENKDSIVAMKEEFGVE